MMQRAIANATFVDGEGFKSAKAIVFERTITKLLDDAPKDCETIDAQGLFVAPAFIDLHIHGLMGADVMDATPDALEIIGNALPRFGVGAFLATTMTMPKEAIAKALENIAAYKECQSGAIVLGAHLEGPFINPKKAGAQDAMHVSAFDEAFIANHAQTVKMITFAPELEGAHGFIAYIRKHHPDILLSLGHSDATYDEAKAAFEAGARHVTHLFNAMRSYHHREPGIVGALFDGNVTADIIADTVHTHPHHLRLAFRMLPDRLALITDAMQATCLKCGEYMLGGQNVTVEEGKATLDNGTLAGSVLTFDRALYNFRQAADASLPQLMRMSSQLPASLLGLKKGALKRGYDADLVLFDENFSIKMTIIGGKIVYEVR